MLQCLGPWLDDMVDPTIISTGLADLQTWLTSTLTPDVNAVTADLAIYTVSALAVARMGAIVLNLIATTCHGCAGLCLQRMKWLKALTLAAVEYECTQHD